MTREQYLAEIDRFKSVLTALDATHRLNGNVYTPSDIQQARKAVCMLKLMVETGIYDFKTQLEFVA